jgi:hypothetical protein
MKRLLAIFCLSLLTFLQSSAVFADDAALLSERLAARRDLTFAKLELRHYWQVEYPRQRRHLNAAIELTELEIRNMKQLLRSYDPFDNFITGQPLELTIQELRLCLREAELRLTDLWAERNALVRFHSDDWRVLEMKVQDARMRVIALEPAEEAVVEPIAERPAI